MSSLILPSKFLEGKVCLVTGAGRGIGKATARILAAHGATVGAVSRTEENARQTAEIIKQEGGNAFPVTCDVSDSKQVEQAVRQVLEIYRGIHVLVNNAGVTQDALLVRMKDEDWEKVIRTNLTGTFYFSRAVVKGMMKQREGKIVNISSIIGLIGNSGQANYAAGKAGILGFTKSLAREIASRGITVNAIAPGFISTDMTENLPEPVKTDLLSRIPMGTLGIPEDVASVVLFLVSPLARYITGQVIHVDGGMVM